MKHHLKCEMNENPIIGELRSLREIVFNGVVIHFTLN